MVIPAGFVPSEARFCQFSLHATHHKLLQTNYTGDSGGIRTRDFLDENQTS